MKLSPKIHGIALLVAVLLGGGFALIQFGISELTYQAGMRGFGGDGMFEVSDAVSWPAGLIYDSVDKKTSRQFLQDIIQENGSDADKARKLLLDFEDEYLAPETDPEWDEAYWELVDARGWDGAIPLTQEYLIYGGVCLAWGALIGLLSYLVVILIVKVIPNREGA